jgi:hypothetical protein
MTDRRNGALLDGRTRRQVRPLTRQIGSVFASLSGEAEVALPERFVDLKR